jgi:hypothetical protein
VRSSAGVRDTDDRSPPTPALDQHVPHEIGRARDRRQVAGENNGRDRE